jgi:lipopolysaccharide transport protein LptA
VTRRQARWHGVATACLAIAAIVVLDGRVTVLAQSAGAHAPLVSANSGDDFDSGGDSIRVTGGVEGAPATPAAEAATAAPEVPPAPQAAAPKAVAGAPAPLPSLSAPAVPVPPRAVAAAPAAAPSLAASASVPRPVAGRPAIPIPEPAVAEEPAFAPSEPAIPVATAPSAGETAGGAASGAGESAESAPAAKPNPEVASAAPPASGFPGSEFSANHGPIDIKSDSMALDYNGKSILFSGHVRAVQAGGQLTSDKLRVTYGDNFHDVKEMLADGNVRISQGSRWETSDHAVLDQTKHTVVLTGSPVVHQGPDQITGKRITVHLDTGQSVVEGARAVIFPKGGETAAGQQAAPPDGAPGEHLP